jgi:hypothetical protein
MPYIIDNITANTINVKDTLLIKGQSIENVIATESYDVKPTSTKLTRIPNNYIGWRDKNDNPFWQSVEISSITEEVVVNLIAAEFGIFGFASPGAFINVGDTITISGASVAGNNGVWEVTGALRLDGSAVNVTVKQTADRKLTDELVPEPSNITCTYQKRTIVELSWVQAQLEDGTQIWEAYDYNNNWDGEDIDGYWVVIKPNYETGETTVLSTLKMSENFWDYWYDYTVKVEGEPNSIILTTLGNNTSGGNNVDSYNFKLTVTNGILSLQETNFDLEKTWNELYNELTGELAVELRFSSPWYNSDNDYYGMMYGPEMGWYWAYESTSQYYVGYNMLTGETQLIDVSESFVNIKNINYMGGETPEGTLSNALKLINTVISNPKYGLLLQLNSDDNLPSPTALWSPNYTNVEYATLLDMVDNRGDLINEEGNISFDFRWTITNDYFINANFYSTNGGVSFTRKKLDGLNEESEYETITSVFNFSFYNNFFYMWETENSLIVSYPNSFESNTLSNDNFFVWRNDKQYPEFIKTPNMYPNMIEDGKLTGWYNSITNAEIITMTNNFKNNTF